MVDMLRQRRHIAILSGVWPCLSGNNEAAEVVFHEIARCFAALPDFRVSVGCITLDGSADPPPPSLAALEGLGVRVLPPIKLRRLPPGDWQRRVESVVLARPGGVIPGADGADILVAALAGDQPDAIVTVWSELATAATYGLPTPRLAYYGNPDHKTALARFWFRMLHGWRDALRQPGEILRIVREALWIWSVQRAHIKVMRNQDVVMDVASNDAETYRSRGVQNAQYVRNMWPAAPTTAWRALRDQTEQTVPLKIVGSIGNMSATNNTYGLHLLATRIVPNLRKRLGEGAFEVHLFGGRLPHPAVDGLLTDPHFRRRGFVDDLDTELLSAPVFLVANNFGWFRVGHTRFLHAWSLGACVVAFRGSAEAMPELRHGENALLADSVEELVDCIAQAAADKNLRRRLGEGGIATLTTLFGPEIVVNKLADELRQLLAGRQP